VISTEPLADPRRTFQEPFFVARVAIIPDRRVFRQLCMIIELTRPFFGLGRRSSEMGRADPAVRPPEHGFRTADQHALKVRLCSEQGRLRTRMALLALKARGYRAVQESSADSNRARMTQIEPEAGLNPPRRNAPSGRRGPWRRLAGPWRARPSRGRRDCPPGPSNRSASRSTSAMRMSATEKVPASRSRPASDGPLVEFILAAREVPEAARTRSGPPRRSNSPVSSVRNCRACLPA
jgi:hypothetical protein